MSKTMTPKILSSDALKAPKHNSSDVAWKHKASQLLTAAFGAIPLSLGRKIRRWSYRSFMGQIGKDVFLGTGLDLMGTDRIFLKDNSMVLNGVRLNCRVPNSRIVLGPYATLERDICLVSFGGCIEIGEKTGIGPFVCMGGPGDITIGKNCLIASHSSLYANNHIYSDPSIPIIEQGYICKGIVIEDDCWIGSGVRILDGVTIGHGSIVGAGAVVTKSIPPYSIAVGVPAKVVSQRKQEPQVSVVS